MLGEERKNIKENLKNKMMKSDIEGSVKIEKKIAENQLPLHIIKL